jgi:hypothetical protein
MLSQKLGSADELSVLARVVPGVEGEAASLLRVERPAPHARVQQGADLVAGSPWQEDLVASQHAPGSWRRGGGALATAQAAMDYVALSLFVAAVLSLPFAALAFVIGLV